MIQKLFGRLALARSFVFAMVSLAALALSAFDTPYLTFRSATSFSISITKRWDGTLQKATSNPTEESSWSDWTGTSITAVQTGGQYYIYLRGKNNTFITGGTSTYSGFTLSGSNIYCEGDIETLRDYEGNPLAMATGCYRYLFSNCSSLKSAPVLSATMLANGCYYGMFKGCSSLAEAPDLPATTMKEECYRNMFQSCTSLRKIPSLPSTTASATGATRCYFMMFDGCTSLEVNTSGPGVEWTIPVQAESGAASWNYNVFANTGGSFTGDPLAGTTYYVASALPPGQIYQAPGSGTLDVGLVGFAYTRDLTSTIKNGTTPYTFTFASGTLPPELTVSGSTLSGTPTTAGDYDFSLSVVDDESHELASASYSLKVVQPTVVNTPYVFANGSGANTNCIRLTTDITTLDQEWYVVDGTLNFGTGGVKVSGNVNLVLADGASLTVMGAAKKAGINVAAGNSLTIYGQSDGTGTLTARGNSSDGSDTGGAGIGGNEKESSGTITINGGIINAAGGSSSGGSGIGGGANGNCGVITINGGTVTATGGSYGAGIGGGRNGNGGTVTINNGTVTATAGSSGTGYSFAPTGIGQGYDGSSKGTLSVGATMSVKAGASANPTTEIGRGGSITIGTQRYFFVENAGLEQTENEFSAYVGETKNWNLADTIDGGTPSYAFTPVSGYEPPSGLTLVGTTLSGSVAAASTYTIKYTVTDSSATPLELEAVYTLTVTAPDPLSASTNLGKVKVGKSTDFNLADTISGGVPPYTFGYTGSLPTGFSLSGSTLSFATAAAGNYACEITVTDQLGTTISPSPVYTVEAIVSAGFIDDDPEEPASGVTVDCLTPDGVFPRTCTQVENSSTAVVWEDSWYYVTGNVVLSKGVVVNGKVSLILGDNATLTVNGESNKAGIRVAVDGSTTNSLTIYSQSKGADMGELVSSGGSGGAGIGGDNKNNGLGDCGKVTIYGGVITATGNGDAAGIGGGDYQGAGGTVTIYGGSVTATTTSTYGASGIGGGYNGVGGRVAIYGGTVTATGSNSSQAYAGIGGKTGMNQGSLTVGGNVVVKAGSSVTLADSDVKNPNGETEISLATIYQYYQVETTGPAPLAQTTSAFAAYVGELFELALPGTVSGGTGSYTFTLKTPASLPAWLSRSGDTLSGTPSSASDSCALTFTVQDATETSLSEDFTYTITAGARPKTITYIDGNDGVTVLTGLAPTTYTPGVGAVLPTAASSPTAGYELDGWYKDSACTDGPVTSVPDAATADQTFYAKWRPINYTITYKDGDTDTELPSSALPALAPTTYTVAAATPLPETATKSGFGFYGWFTNSSCTGMAVETIPAGTTGNKTFWAKWGVAKVPTNYVDENEVAQSAECSEIGNDTTILQSGWYVVSGNVSIDEMVTISGSVNLILAEGATFAVTSTSHCAINLVGDNSLTIYGQSGGTGRLEAGSKYILSAGIGGDSGQTAGRLTVNGGVVIASGASGIGGGYQGAGGTVTINGGTVIATATGSGAGIGGGLGGNGGTVTVNGGTVAASGNYNAGVGGGNGASSQGALTVGANVVVRAGSSENPETVLNPNGETDLTSLLTRQYYFTFETVGPLPLGIKQTDFNVTTGTVASINIARTVSGGVPPYSFALVGNFPTGFAFDESSTCVITGLVETVGTYMFPMTVTDDSGMVSNVVYKIHGVEANGYTEDDPDEPASGVEVDCLTPDGLFKRTCQQLTSTDTEWENSWYYVTGEVTIDGTVTVVGKVSLVLGDNARLTVHGVSKKAGINVTPGNSLTIYAQSDDVDAGMLVARAGGSGAGIGGNDGEYCGKINLYGGYISAFGGMYGAGIGSGEEAGTSGYSCEVLVAGGAVTATGGTLASGIGGGYDTVGGNISVTGGSIVATAGSDAASGIGGYTYGNRDHGTLNVAANMVVRSGASENPAGTITPDENGDVVLDGKQYYIVESSGATPEGANKITYMDGEEEILGLDPDSYYENSGVFTTLPTASTVTKTGYTFDGWYTNAQFTGDIALSIWPDATGDKTFWAKFTPVVYSIRYYDGLTELEDLEPSSFTIADTAKLLPSLEDEAGRSFGGWCRQSDCSDEPALTLPAGSYGDTIFYAKWTVGEYSIIYMDGVTPYSDVSPKTYTFGTKVKLPVPPAKDDAIFCGWFDNSGFEGDVVTEIPADATGTQTFYAKWEAMTGAASTTSFTGIDGTQMEEECAQVIPAITDWTNGWYVVRGIFEINSSIKVSGNVNLVLADNSQLTISDSTYGTAGIRVPWGSSLTIYAQQKGNGELTATGNGTGAGIGGINGVDCGRVTINGGVVKVIGGALGAGIGGANGSDGGDVVVNGGSLTAFGHPAIGAGNKLGGGTGDMHGTLLLGDDVTAHAALRYDANTMVPERRTTLGTGGEIALDGSINYFEIVKGTRASPDTYLAFTSPWPFTIEVQTPRWLDTLQKGDIYYSTDAVNWTIWDGSHLESVIDGYLYALYFRGTDNKVISFPEDGCWSIDGYEVSCTGDIETLRDWRGNPPPMGDNCYMSMFEYCEALVSPPTLSATNLSAHCYDGMFMYCTSLTTLPVLPALELAEGCYDGMFMGTGVRLFDMAPGTPWSIPAAVKLPPSGKCGFLMFGNTGIGYYTDDYPVIGKTYYVKGPDDPDPLHMNPYLTPFIYSAGTSMNYDLRLMIKGGVAPFTFETTAATGEYEGLPAGLSLVDGVLTGTVSGSLNAHRLKLLVSDATGREVEMVFYLYYGSITQMEQITPNLGPVPAYVPIHDWAGGYEIYLTEYISGCIGGCYVFEKEDTLHPLPEDLLMDITGSGRLVAVRGMPEPGEYPFEVTVRDYAGRSQDFMFTLTITTNREPVLVSATPNVDLVNLYTGEKADFSVAVSDPDGLPISSYTWVLDGVYYSDESSNFSFTPSARQVEEKSIVVLKCLAWDGHYLTRVKSWTLNLCGWRHEITTDSLPSATVGEDYEVHLAGVGRGGEAEWYLADGDRLPPGLIVSVDGTISGVARLSGSYTFRVVRMEGDLITSKEFTLVVDGTDSLPTTFGPLADDIGLQMLAGKTIPGDTIVFADGAEIATLVAGDFPGVTFSVPSGTARFIVDVEAPLDAQNLVVAAGASVVFEAVAARPYFGRYSLVHMPETMAGTWSLETPFYLACEAAVDEGWLVFDALGGKDDLDGTITVLFPDGPDARAHELTGFATSGGLLYRDESSVDGTSVLGSTLTLKGENSFGGAIDQIEGNTSIVLAPGASLRIGSTYALGGTLAFSEGASLKFCAPAEGAVVSNAVCGGVIVPPASGTANLVLETALTDGDSITVFDFYTGSASSFVLVPPDGEDATHYSLACEEGKLLVKCAPPVPAIGPGDMTVASGDAYEIAKTSYFSEHIFEVGNGTGPYTWSCPLATYAIARSANSFDGTSGATELVLRQRATTDNTIRLGFEFPFGGTLYNEVRIGMNGCIIPVQLATEYGYIRVFGPDCPDFATANDIFVSRAVGSATIRFGNYASVTLAADGSIRTAYGPLAGGVAPRYAPVDIEVASYGASFKERVARFEPESEVSGGLRDVVFTPTGSIPYGLNFTTNRVNSAKAGFSGSTKIAGTYPLVLQCTDSLGHVMTTQVVITVTGDTPYPKATAVLPSLSTDGTVHVQYGDSKTFSFEGIDPANCKWYWGVEQVADGVASYTLDTSTLPYPVLGESSKNNLHTKVLSCRFQDTSTYGFVVVASWQVIINTRYYVDASAVDASPDGTEAHPFHTFTEYTVNALAGDEFIVKPGKYKVPFVAPAYWPVKLRSTDGAEVTMISVNASDKACFMQGGANGPGTTATVEGFTLVNAGGRAAYGGTLVNCILRDSALSANGGIASDDFGYGGGAYGSRLVGCVVSGCSAVWGGGVASSELWNCTVIGNSAAELGGGMDGASVAYNTALWGNRAGADGHESNATEKTPKPGYILPLQPTTQNCIFEEDPLLYADGRPSATSPCLKAGNSGLVPADVPGYAVDMAGDARSAQPTIGAYENAAESGLCRIVVESVGAGTVDRAPYFDAEPGQSVLFTFNGRPAAKVSTNGVVAAENVTTFAWDNISGPGNLFVEFAPADLYVDAAEGALGNNGLSWDSPFVAIGYAIAAAGDGDIIHVKPGVYSSILITSLNPIKNLHIVSTDGPEVTVIDANHISHCFEVGTDRPGIVLEGFTLQNGRATGQWGGGGAYGGTLIDCIVQNCESLGGYSGTVARGGGTYETTLINCIVRNCRAGKSVSEGTWYCNEAEGGGVWGGSAEKCEIYGNSCWGTIRSEGAGTYGTVMRDCYVYNNKIGTLQEHEAILPAADAALNTAGDAVEIRVETREPTMSERNDTTDRILVGDMREYATESEALAAKADGKQLPDITLEIASKIASDRIDTYTGMFEIKTVQNTETGKWENKPELKDSVVTELRQNLTDALRSLATTASLTELGTGVTEFTLVNPKPGLYYAMEFSETLGGGAAFSGPRYLSDGHSVRLTVEHHDSPTGFWRMSVYKTPTGE